LLRSTKTLIPFKIIIKHVLTLWRPSLFTVKDKKKKKMKPFSLDYDLLDWYVSDLSGSPFSSTGSWCAILILDVCTVAANHELGHLLRHCTSIWQLVVSAAFWTFIKPGSVCTDERLTRINLKKLKNNLYEYKLFML
jgi:hypothetical protein